jgi:hypothetical protein
MCNYKSIYNPIKMKCGLCPLDGQYTTDTRGNKCHRCEDLSEAYMRANYLSDFEQSKLKALCQYGVMADLVGLRGISESNAANV